MTHGTAISTAPQWALEEGARRYAIISPLLRDHPRYDPKATLANIAKSSGTKPRNLYNWLSRYEDGGRSPAALIDKPRGGKGRSRSILDERLLGELKSMGLSLMRASGEDRIPTAAVRQLIEPFCRANGFPIPSRYAVRRVLLSIPRSERIYAARGPEGWLREVASKPPIKRAIAPLQLVSTDVQVLDLFVLDGERERRPRLCVFVDEFSGAVLGFSLTFEETSVAAALGFRHMVLPKSPELDPQRILCGIPARLHPDRGKNFLSTHLKTISLELGCEIVPAVARSPWAKPAETTFSVLTRQLIRYLQGYVGKPGRKPLKSKKLLTIDKAREVIGAYLFKIYNRAPFHVRRIAGSRISRYDLHGSVDVVRHLPRDEELTRQMLKPERRQTSMQGIRMFGTTFWHDALTPLAEEMVDVEVRYDPGDLGGIDVYHRGRWLCRATNPLLDAAQATYQDVRQRLDMRRERLNGVKASVDPVLEAAESTETYFSRLADQRQQERAAAAGGRPHRTVPVLLAKGRSASRPLGRGARRLPRGPFPLERAAQVCPGAGVKPDDEYDPFAPDDSGGSHRCTSASNTSRPRSSVDA